MDGGRRQEGHPPSIVSIAANLCGNQRRGSLPAAIGDLAEEGGMREGEIERKVN